MSAEEFLAELRFEKRHLLAELPVELERLEMSLYIPPEVERAGAIIDRHLTVQAAASYSGYSIQYLRRLLRDGTLKGMKIGQVWLINWAAFDHYVIMVRLRDDRRYGPRMSSISNRGVSR